MKQHQVVAQPHGVQQLLSQRGDRNNRTVHKPRPWKKQKMDNLVAIDRSYKTDMVKMRYNMVQHLWKKNWKMVGTTITPPWVFHKHHPLGLCILGPLGPRWTIFCWASLGKLPISRQLSQSKLLWDLALWIGFPNFSVQSMNYPLVI